MFKDFFKKTEVAYLLTRISKLLPEGVWLTSFSVKYGSKAADSVGVKSEGGASQDGGVNIELSGYAFTKDPNRQFNMVYKLKNILESDKDLKKYFRSVSLNSIQGEQKENVPVTSFKIVCR